MAFNGRFILNMAHFAARLGANFQELVNMSGYSEEELGKESTRVADQVYNKVLERAVAATNDPYFGLRLSQSQSISAAGLIAQISQTSETVKQALEYCCHFANLGCSALPMHLSEEKDHYKVRLTPNPVWVQQSDIAFRHTAEGVMAFSLREFHSLTHEQYHPIEIHFTWPAPTDLSVYKEVYQCPLLFNQKELAILLRKEHVEQKVITADYELLRILVMHAEEKSRKLDKDHRFSAIVKQSVIQLVKPEFPKIEKVALHLNISPRTLQRRLKAEGQTYQSLTDELKKEFAISYLQRQELSISEIAYLLNYADNSTFTRSFKRWTGQSPQAYRTQLMS
jgi:AraC-like DNA-binding protein